MADCNKVKRHPKITAYMNNLLEEYKNIRGQQKDSLKPFWNAVVITASDTAQKTAYELQIKAKQSRNELPLDLQIFVVSDPPGVRIGNGGSTLTSLEFLHQNFGDEMYNMKILLIHAGGWSQRMPSSSVLGKVFSILPLGHPPFQMLDLKLALYWPFIEKIQPGVFLTCADDFLVFDLVTDKEWKIPGQGFTALAHPSTLEFGKSHGVYVFDEEAKIDPTKNVEIKQCLKVLQKPSESRMKKEKALLKGEFFTFGDGIELEGEVVYTDSCYYFGVDIMKKLLQFKLEVGNLSCEIDAYGDFLQAVGKNATDDYIDLTFNVSQLTENLLDMRRKVFHTLNGSDIHILVLNSSKFIHIGTTKELLYHFIKDLEFQDQMCLSRNTFNRWEVAEIENMKEEDSKTSDCFLNEGKNLNVVKESCAVHCLLTSGSDLGSNCYLEFCHFEIPTTLSHNCIISNCHVSSAESKLDTVIIPANLFLHTVPIISPETGATLYVTIFFNTDDNLKKSVPVKDIRSLPFLESTVGDFVDIHSLTTNDLIPLKDNEIADKSNEDGNFKAKNLDSYVEKVSLWNLKLFTAQTSMTSSFEEFLSIISEKQPKKAKVDCKRFSIANLLNYKNVGKMLKFRKKLFDKINNKTS